MLSTGQILVAALLHGRDAQGDECREGVCAVAGHSRNYLLRGAPSELERSAGGHRSVGGCRLASDSEGLRSRIP